MKKRIKYYLLTLMLCTCFFNVYGIVASADAEKEENDTVYTANTIYMGSLVEGNISKTNDVDYYKFSIVNNGYINIDFNHNYLDNGRSYWKISLYDAAQNFLFSRDFSGNKIKNSTLYLGVAAGTYYLRVDRSTWHSEEQYNFRVNYERSDTWETELNNSFERADSIALNTSIFGCIMEGDDVDFYSFTLPADGNVALNFQNDYIDSGSSYWKATLYNGDNQILYSRTFQGNNVIQNVPAIGVAAGVYYLRVDRSTYCDEATYNFKIQYQVAGDWEKEFNDSFYTTQDIRCDETVKANIMEGDDEDFFSFTVNNTKTMRVNFKHAYLDSGSEYWKLLLYNATFKEIIAYKYGGNNVNSTSAIITFVPGKYYIRVGRSTYHTDLPYNFTLVSVLSGENNKNNGNEDTASKSPSEKNIRINKIKLNKAASTLHLGNKNQKAKSLKLKATISPSEATNKKVTWKTSNSKVATVSSKGVVKAKGVGTATITCIAKDGSGKKASCKITVKPGKAAFERVITKGSKIKFTIKKQSNVTGFQIYVKRKKGGSYKKYKTLKASSRTFTVSKNYYRTHQFKVRAYKKIGRKTYYGAFSNAK